MPGPYPKELRDRVIAAYVRKEGTYDELAVRFSVGPATVDRWLARHRRTGSVAPSQMGGARHKRKVDQQGEEFVAAVLAEVPDSTREELADAFLEEFGVKMHPTTMGKSMRRMGYTRKRGVYARRRASGKT